MGIIHYSHVQWIWLLLLLPLLAAIEWRRELRRRSDVGEIIDPDHHPELWISPARRRSLANRALYAISVVLVTLALMDPWISVEESSRVNPLFKLLLPVQTSMLVRESDESLIEQVIVIDTSGSMTARDGLLSSSRLEEARLIAAKLVEGDSGRLVSLYAAADGLRIVVPPTVDLPYLFSQLMELPINPSGHRSTDFAKAIQELKSRYWSEKSNRKASIVWLTDGEETSAEKISPDAIKPLFEGAREAQTHFFWVGLGNPQGTPLPAIEGEARSVVSSQNSAFLQVLSDASNGEYLNAYGRSSAEVADALKALVKLNNGIRNNEGVEMTQSAQVGMGYALAPLLALLALIAAIGGWLSRQH